MADWWMQVEGRPDRLDGRIARGSYKQRLLQKGTCFEIGESTLNNRERGRIEEMRDRRKQKANVEAMLHGVGRHILRLTSAERRKAKSIIYVWKQ